MESPAGCMESVAKRRHGITRQRVFLLRIDYIQHSVLIPYRRQAADFIHGFAVILQVTFFYYESIWGCQFDNSSRKSLFYKDFFGFLGEILRKYFVTTPCEPSGLEPSTIF